MSNITYVNFEVFQLYLLRLDIFCATDLFCYSVNGMILGDIVLCHFEYDNNWYRAEVIDVKDVSGSVEIEVFYIDYGNIETVTIDRYVV